MKTLLRILVVFALMAVIFGSIRNEYVVFNLPGHKFSVPLRNVPQLGYFRWIYGIPGLDKEAPGFIFKIPGTEVASEIQGYQKKDHHIELSLTGMVSVMRSGEQKEAMSSRPLAALWAATDSYKDRIVVPDDVAGLFRVYTNSTYNRGWEVLNKFPDSSKPMPLNIDNFWVATCIGGIRYKDGGEIVGCTSRFTMGDILVEFSFSRKNLTYVNEIREYLRRTIATWESKK